MSEEATDSPHQPHVNVTVNHPHTPAAMGVLERKWIVALLLSIFLGWLGIDRFYLGRSGIGLLKFFTFGLFGILWLVDILMIATKSVRGISWSD